MASYFNLTLDTLAPSGVTLQINGGALYTASASVSLSIGCSDGNTSGYTMKVYGSVVGATSAEEASWEAFSTTKTITLSSGDGLKTVYVVVRDNVWNESSAVSATITLNTAIPVVTITGPDVNVISKISGKDTSIFNFISDQTFTQYIVGVVSSTNSTYDTATQIPTDGGSINTSGNGEFDPESNIQVTIKGADFSTAVSGEDGTHIVKVFVKNQAGTWSA